MVTNTGITYDVYERRNDSPNAESPNAYSPGLWTVSFRFEERR